MRSLQQRIAAVTNMRANLIARLRELDRLREEVRKAQSSARRLRLKRRNGEGAISRSPLEIDRP